jgi:hypothetical protein
MRSWNGASRGRAAGKRRMRGEGPRHASARVKPNPKQCGPGGIPRPAFEAVVRVSRSDPVSTLSIGPDGYGSQSCVPRFPSTPSTVDEPERLCPLWNPLPTPTAAPLPPYYIIHPGHPVRQRKSHPVARIRARGGLVREGGERANAQSNSKPPVDLRHIRRRLGSRPSSWHARRPVTRTVTFPSAGLPG